MTATETISLSHVLIAVGTYFIIMLFAVQHASFSSPYQQSNRKSPIIGKRNATRLAQQRLDAVRKDYESVMQSTSGWTALRTGSNVTVERMTSSDGWPDYLRTIAYIEGPPQQVMKAFSWENFHTAQRAIDPFYESSKLLYENSKTLRIIEKTTKRPLIYPRRQFIFAMSESTQKADKEMHRKIRHGTVPTSIDQPLSESARRHSALAVGSTSKLLIPKGTLMSTLTTVKLAKGSDDDFDGDAIQIGGDGENGGYVKAFQDFIAWFVPDKKNGGTLLVIIMRVDLGSDIPRWAFLTTVAATGIWSMRALADYVKKSAKKR